MALPGPSTPSSSSPVSGVRSILQYSGIPSWLLRRPKLPSRNWLIFLSVVGGISSLYVYDRRQCRLIKEEYIARVRHLADEPLGSMDYPRCVRVLVAKSPGDDDAQKGLQYFKKYVKPILVAAAVDYDLSAVGKRHGDLAKLIAREIHRKRFIAAGLLPPPMAITPGRSMEELERRELEGGTVIVGRAAFKEYMEGLRRGWDEELVLEQRKEDDFEEETLARQLANDGRFDEPEETAGDVASDWNELKSLEQQPKPFRNPFLPDSIQLTPRSYPTPPPSPSGLQLPPPSAIPPQPPLLLLPYTNFVGFSLLHRQLWGFFNRRQRQRLGAEQALLLIHSHTRALTPSDLSFGLSSENFYLSSFDKTPEKIAKQREEYYKELEGRLASTRALERGERAMTKEEEKRVPMTEVELRQERLNREKRWRGEEQGYEIVRRERGVEWDDRICGGLNVFVKGDGGPTS